MKKFDEAFLRCIRSTSITWLRCGKEHPKFTGIWMVEVQGRIFGRSYYLRERSWYNAFLNVGKGEIKCGDFVRKVSGVKPHDLGMITEAVNEAYQFKYGNKPNNQKWIDGLKNPDQVAKTMEFVAA